jgi:hypothetical protein
MPFEPYAETIDPRAPEMLDRAPIPTDVAGVFLPSLYDTVAPGLYPDEKVYLLDTGEKIALSVSTARKPNGGGMDFTGWARVIEDDGRTMLDKADAEMELEFRWSCDAGTFERLDEEASPAEVKVGREIMLMMLGEPPTMAPIAGGDPDAPPTEVAADMADWERNPHKAPPGTVLSPGATEAPLIGWATELKLNASIRHALKLFERSAPEVDVATLLAEPA